MLGMKTIGTWIAPNKTLWTLNELVSPYSKITLLGKPNDSGVPVQNNPKGLLKTWPFTFLTLWFGVMIWMSSLVILGVFGGYWGSIRGVLKSSFGGKHISEKYRKNKQEQTCSKHVFCIFWYRSLGLLRNRSKIQQHCERFIIHPNFWITNC